MARSLQELIDYLLAEIALCGDQGRSFFFFWYAASHLQDVNPLNASNTSIPTSRGFTFILFRLFLYYLPYDVVHENYSDFTIANGQQGLLYLIF